MCVTKQQSTFKDAVMKKYVPKVSCFSAAHSKYIFEGLEQGDELGLQQLSN